MSTTARQITARICRVADSDEQLVTAVVYEPNTFDTYGEFMLPEDVRQIAHKFMQLDLKNVIDTNHDNVPNGSYPVESYLTKEGDPDFAPGTWVLTVKVADDLWPAVLDGRINGFSFEAMVELVEYDVEVTTVRDHVGRTVRQKGDSEDHDHLFFAVLNERGKVIGGNTSETNGHSHVIKHGTFTEDADGHNHRFVI